MAVFTEFERATVWESGNRNIEVVISVEEGLFLAISECGGIYNHALGAVHLIRYLNPGLSRVVKEVLPLGCEIERE